MRLSAETPDDRLDLMFLFQGNAVCRRFFERKFSKQIKRVRVYTTFDATPSCPLENVYVGLNWLLRSTEFRPALLAIIMIEQ